MRSISPNFKLHINAHNMNISKNLISNNETASNSVSEDICPINKQTNCIVYQANLTSIENSQHETSYIGISETSFKKRFVNHKEAFNNDKTLLKAF